jgi:GntR family transcriptional regulator / MocR family aminotransferase
VVLPPALVEPYVAARAAVDRYSPTLEQAVLNDFFAEGYFDQHIRRTREVYRERRDALLAAAARHLTGRLDVEPTDAGLHTIGWLPQRTHEEDAAAKAWRLGVEITPLSHYERDAKRRPGVLLGFAGVPVPSIHRAVESLARALGK